MLGLNSIPKPDKIWYRHPKHAFTDYECKLLLANWIPVRDIKRYLNGVINVEGLVWECSKTMIYAYIATVDEFIDSGAFTDKAVAVLLAFQEKLKKDYENYIDGASKLPLLELVKNRGLTGA